MPSLKGRYKVVVAVYGVFRKGNKVLFMRRSNTGYMDGRYSLPAGHVEPGEGAVECLVREANEEIGVEINAKDVLFLHCDFLRRSVDKTDERIHVFFEVTKWQGEPQNMEPHKCDDLKWFDQHNLPENLADELVDVMDLISKKILYSEHDLNT